MDTNNFKKLMDKSIQHLENEFSHLQIGRASTSLLENVDVYIPEWNMKQPLNQLSNINIVDAQTMRVEPWDKSNISHIEKGIYDAKIGVTPINQGSHLLVKIPPLTKERRQELTKIASKLGEEAKISIRNIRHDALKLIKKELDDKLIGEDQEKKLEKEINDQVKDFNNQIEQKIKNKSDEIMKI